ncbi:MAG: VCBS repeat-containing protein, partial [Ilumatobacteraceae bacterium]
QDHAGDLVGQPQSFPVETTAYRYTGGHDYDLNERGELYDLDGDGAIDLVVPGARGGVNVIYGNGDGTFGAPVTVNVLPNMTPEGGWTDAAATRGQFQTTVALAVTDVDDDGRGDIVAATVGTGEWAARGRNHSTVAVVSATGPRQFASAEVTPTLPGTD